MDTRMGIVNLIKQAFSHIQLHIITIFLLLLSGSSIGIITFTYYKNYQSVLELSDAIITQLSNETISKIEELSAKVNLLANIYNDIFAGLNDISFKNQEMLKFLTNLLKNDRTLRSMNLALLDGSYTAIVSVKNSDFAKTIPDLPDGTEFTFRTITVEPPPRVEMYRFLDANLKVLEERPVLHGKLDIRTDPWFIEMKEKQKVTWSNVYVPRGVPRDKQDPALVLSLPIFNKSKAYLGAISFNVSWTTLSTFITKLKVGKAGRVFVLDENGGVVLPLRSDLDAKGKTYIEKLITPGFAVSQANKKKAIKLAIDQKEYLLYFVQFPLPIGVNWTVALAVPFEDFFGGVIKTQRDSLLISMAIVLFAYFLVYFFSKRISKPIIELSNEVEKIQHFNFEEGKLVKTHIHELVTLQTAIRNMRAAVQSFASYVPQDIVKTLIGQGKELKLGGVKQKIVLLFSDIKDFTTIAESTPIEDLVPALERYFDVISTIVSNSQGTIDKYIGDSVMAFWGAPIVIEDPVNRACIAALQCCFSCNRNQLALKLPPWKTRFGLHTGEVIVGNFGTRNRMNYTAIGDAVNTTSRITALNKIYGTDIIISEAIYVEVGRSYVTRPLDRLAVKGKKNQISVYELVGTLRGDLKATDEQIRFCERFTEAYELYFRGQYDKAKEAFTKILVEFPNDVPTQIYLNRIEKGLQGPLSLN